MKPYIITILGTHNVWDEKDTEKTVDLYLRMLVKIKPCIHFYVCRTGAFDRIVTSVIRRLRRECNLIHWKIFLLLPYPYVNVDSICAQYDKVILPKAEPPKSRQKAIAMRNKWAVKHADHVMFYTNFEDSPAYEAFEYAKELEVDGFNFDFTLPEDDLQHDALARRNRFFEEDL